MQIIVVHLQENELQSMHKDLMKELERLKAEEMARNIQALNVRQTS